jgi:hypothetical protein
MKLRIALAAIFFCLVSCTFYHYEYIAPKTEAGKNCAMQCLNTKNVCYANMQSQTQIEHSSCVQQNLLNYEVCVNRTKNRDEAKNCNPNSLYCSTSPNYFNCDETYRQCFSICGGTVKAIKNE